MYIVIVGGGAVGQGLALELAEIADHEVVVVERDRARAAALREEAGELVVQGDGAEVAFLEQIGVHRAELFLAVTGDDGVNLVSAQIARHWFEVPRVVARVNNPRNERLFHLLGITSTVSGAAAVLAQIELDLPQHTLIPLMKLRDSGLEVVDLHVQVGSPAAGQPIRALALPAQTFISMVVGLDGRPRLPAGDTVLEAGDEVIAVIPRESEEELRALMAPAVDDAERAYGDDGR